MADICDKCKKPRATDDAYGVIGGMALGGARPADWPDCLGSHLCWRRRAAKDADVRARREGFLAAQESECAPPVGTNGLCLELGRLLGMQSPPFGRWDYRQILDEVEALLHQVAALHEGQSTLAKHVERLTTNLREATAEKARLQSLVVALEGREPAACTQCHGDLVVCRECGRRRSDMRHVDMVAGHGPCRGAGMMECPCCGGRGGIWLPKEK